MFQPEPGRTAASDLRGSFHDRYDGLRIGSELSDQMLRDFVEGVFVFHSVSGIEGDLHQLGRMRSRRNCIMAPCGN